MRLILLVIVWQVVKSAGDIIRQRGRTTAETSELEDTQMGDSLAEARGAGGKGNRN